MACHDARRFWQFAKNMQSSTGSGPSYYSGSGSPPTVEKKCFGCNIKALILNFFLLFELLTYPQNFVKSLWQAAVRKLLALVMTENPTK
jgi:hypothetical protein